MARNARLGCLLSVIVLASGCAEAPELPSPDGDSETGAGADAKAATEAAAQDGSTADATLSDDGSDDAGSVAVDGSSPGDASEAAPAEDALGGDASPGPDASDAGDSADSEFADATNDGGPTPDGAPPMGDPLLLSTTLPGGGTVDPVSLGYPMQIEGYCGQQSMPMESLPHTGVAPSFSVTNAGGVPVDWTGTVTGAAFGLDLTGSTLAPGGSVTVQITPLAIPSAPSSALIGRATVTIHANVGPGFDQSFEVDEYLVACVISADPTSLNFGDVPLDGGSSTMQVTLNATCHEPLKQGIYSPLVYLGSSGSSGPAAFTPTQNRPYPWQVTFVPAYSVGNPVGTQSAYLTITIGPGAGIAEPICGAFANGFFVQGTGVATDATADASAE